MSFVGKLVIVFQVAFSFVFMAFAGAVYTAQVNWKSKAESLESEKQTAQQNLNQQMTQWEAERSDLQNQMADMESRAKTAEQLVQDRETELNGLKSDYDQLKTAEKVFEAEAGLSKEEAEARREEAYRQRDVNTQLHEEMEKLVASYRASRDENFALKKEREAMQRKHLAALEEIATWKLIAQANNWNKDPKKFAQAQAPPPVVQGVVIGAEDANDRGTERLVEISLGERDGLVEGHHLDVYRPAILNQGRPMYLGEIRLVSVTPNRAVGIVTVKAKNGTITKDDHVTTQL